MTNILTQYIINNCREHSSAGRASALQAEGHRFEPCCSHQNRSSFDERFLFYILRNKYPPAMGEFIFRHTAAHTCALKCLSACICYLLFLKGRSFLIALTLMSFCLLSYFGANTIRRLLFHSLCVKLFTELSYLFILTS